MDFFETFSPVIKASTIRIVFILVVSKWWNIQQIDVNNAFLNRELHEDVFMTKSKGFLDANKPHHVCKLSKAQYGLKQTPKAWFEKLRGALIAWGFQNSISDISLFYTHKNGNLPLLLMYDDDIIIIMGESSEDIQQAITDLNHQFAHKNIGTVNYFLGFEVTRTSSQLHLSQSKYVADLLPRKNMVHSKSCSITMLVFDKIPNIEQTWRGSFPKNFNLIGEEYKTTHFQTQLFSNLYYILEYSIQLNLFHQHHITRSGKRSANMSRFILVGLYSD